MKSTISALLCLSLVVALLSSPCAAQSGALRPSSTGLATRAWNYLFGASGDGPIPFPINTEEYTIEVAGTSFDPTNPDAPRTPSTSSLSMFSKEFGYISFEDTSYSQDEISGQVVTVTGNNMFEFNTHAKLCYMSKVPTAGKFRPVFTPDAWEYVADVHKDYDTFKLKNSANPFEVFALFIKGTSEFAKVGVKGDMGGDKFNLIMPVLDFNAGPPVLSDGLKETLKNCKEENSDAGIKGSWQATLEGTGSSGETTVIRVDSLLDADGNRHIRADIVKDKYDHSTILYFNKDGDLVIEKSWYYSKFGDVGQCYHQYEGHRFGSYSSNVFVDPSFHEYGKYPLMGEEDVSGVKCKKYGFDKLEDKYNDGYSYKADGVFAEKRATNVLRPLVTMYFNAENGAPVQFQSFCDYGSSGCNEQTMVKVTSFSRDAPDASMFNVPDEWNCKDDEAVEGAKPTRLPKLF